MTERAGGPHGLPWIIVQEDHLNARAFSLWDRDNERICVGLTYFDARGICDAMNAQIPTGHRFPAGQGSGLHLHVAKEKGGPIYYHH